MTGINGHIIGSEVGGRESLMNEQWRPTIGHSICIWDICIVGSHVLHVGDIRNNWGDGVWSLMGDGH